MAALAIEIDFLAQSAHLKQKQAGGKTYVFDPFRRRYVLLQPEEWVRQLVGQHLLRVCGYPAALIGVEKQIVVNGQERRLDLLVHHPEQGPWLLVECKSHKIKLTQAVFDQVAQYNLAFAVPYLMVTNGLLSYCCAMDYAQRSYRFLDAIPARSW